MKVMISELEYKRLLHAEKELHKLKMNQKMCNLTESMVLRNTNKNLNSQKEVEMC